MQNNLNNQRGSSNNDTNNYDDYSSGSTSDEEKLLDSGLYCDFRPRGEEEETTKEASSTYSTNGGGSSNDDNNNNATSTRKGKQTASEEGARRGPLSRVFKLIGGGLGRQASLKDELMDTDSTHNNNNNMSTTKNNSGKKSGRRRGSHMMPEGTSVMKMPTSAELLAQKQMTEGEGTASMETDAVPTTMKVKSSKPRPRRGSHMMPEGGQKMPTSVELLAHKQQQMQKAEAVTASPSPAKAISSKPRRRRGSHFMPEGGTGLKMPTSAELMTQKQQAEASTSAATTATTMSVKSTKPRPRRGPHMMPGGGQQMPTSAELMAQKQMTSPSSIPQDVSVRVAYDDDYCAPKMMSTRSHYTSNDSSGATSRKVQSNKPHSPQAKAQGQMQKLSVAHPGDVTAPSRSFTPMDVSDETSPPEAPTDYGYGEASPSKPSGHSRARRRGSVVKTMMESEKNVDGDGQYYAQASSSGCSNSYNFNASEPMMDTNHLPQRRSSQEAEERGTDSKRPMLKQDAVGESGKRVPIKKKDIGRKAIRAMAADLDYVHKVVPKSQDAKELIYDAIKPNLLFRACAPEELVDLVDAFEPQYVPKGSIVIREGDEGDHFYVMERGGVDVFEKQVHKCSLYSGVAFGEIALLYSCPRTASVLAKYDCKLWSINRRAFRGITAQHKKRRLELKLESLKKVKIHDKVLGEMLKPSELHSMALATKIEKFRKGNAIVQQGEKGDAFYMIEDGTVDVYIETKGNSPVTTLKSGSFFGEKALMSSDVRTATCIASSDVKCMLLMREDFVLMLGDMKDLLDRTYTARDEALQAEHDAMMQKVEHPKTSRLVLLLHLWYRPCFLFLQCLNHCLLPSTDLIPRTLILSAHLVSVHLAS